MKRLYPICVALALQLMTALAWGQGATLRFVATEYPPYTSAHMSSGGAMVMALREALEPAGYKVEVSYQPWSRVNVEYRKFDGVLVLWPPEIATMGLHHFMPVFRSRLGFFGRADTAIDVSSWRAIGQRKIGTGRGYGYPAEFLGAGLNLHPHTDDLVNLRMLSRSRLDLVALERAVGMHLLRTQLADAKAQIRWLEPSFAEIPLGWALTASGPAADAQAQRLRTGLEALQKSGRLAAIARQFDVDSW